MACALAFVVSLAGTSAGAQEPTNQITFFTFSAPFELPGGKTLPAGKYVFKIVDSPSNRHIVHVMRARGPTSEPTGWHTKARLAWASQTAETGTAVVTGVSSLRRSSRRSSSRMIPS